MKVWILLFVNCLQQEAIGHKKYPVNCTVINYTEVFTDHKKCMSVKRDYNNVDAECVKVNVWRE